MLTALTFCVLLATTDPNMGTNSVLTPDERAVIEKRHKHEEVMMSWVWKIAAIVTLLYIVSFMLAGKPIQAIMGAIPLFIGMAIALYIVLIL